MKVLIVDNSVLIRERLATMLGDLKGIDIIGQAESASEALRSIQQLNPNIIILDIHMKNGNAMDVIKIAKRMDPSIIIIVLTDYSYKQYLKSCITAGADFFFDKGKEFEQVRLVLKHLLKKHFGQSEQKGNSQEGGKKTNKQK